MGMSSMLNFRRKGWLAPSGSICEVMSRLSRMSLQAWSISVPYSNSRMSMDTFSRERDVMSFRFSTLFRLFSSIFVRLFSTSVALAPG